MRKVTILGALMAAAAMAMPTQAATVLFTSEALASNPGPSAGETVVEDFDSPLAAGYSWASFNRTLWSNPGNPTGNLFDTGVSGYAGNIPGNNTRYASVFGGTSASLMSTNMLKSISVDIGSIDDYNFIDFYQDNVLIGTITGSELSSVHNGSWTGPDTNRRFFFVGGTFNRIDFRSGGNSFEFDNIATSEVPEPATPAMLALGVLGLAALRRRRKVA